MEHLSLFATDVLVFRPERAAALNAAVLPAILAASEAEAGVTASEVGGWHSTPDLAQRGPPYRPVLDHIVRCVSEAARTVAARSGQPLPPFGWSVEAWAIVLESGGYNRPHDHQPAHFSVAWYVDAGDPPTPDHPMSGALSLLDPRGPIAQPPGGTLWPRTLDIQPESGMLVVFPSFVTHHVHPYFGSRPRVVVSANLRMVGPGG